jgi:hypothetical protein
MPQLAAGDDEHRKSGVVAAHSLRASASAEASEAAFRPATKRAIDAAHRQRMVAFFEALR